MDFKQKELIKFKGSMWKIKIKIDPFQLSLVLFLQTFFNSHYIGFPFTILKANFNVSSNSQSSN